MALSVRFIGRRRLGQQERRREVGGQHAVPVSSDVSCSGPKPLTPVFHMMASMRPRCARATAISRSRPSFGRHRRTAIPPVSAATAATRRHRRPRTPRATRARPDDGPPPHRCRLLRRDDHAAGHCGSCCHVPTSIGPHDQKRPAVARRARAMGKETPRSAGLGRGREVVDVGVAGQRPDVRKRAVDEPLQPGAPRPAPLRWRPSSSGVTNRSHWCVPTGSQRSTYSAPRWPADRPWSCG